MSDLEKLFLSDKDRARCLGWIEKLPALKRAGIELMATDLKAGEQLIIEAAVKQTQIELSIKRGYPIGHDAALTPDESASVYAAVVEARLAAAAFARTLALDRLFEDQHSRKL